MLALRALFRHTMNGATVMTMQMLIRLPMHSEIGITVRTLRLPTTTATDQYGCITTTIQKNEYLFFLARRFLISSIRCRLMPCCFGATFKSRIWILALVLYPRVDSVPAPAFCLAAPAHSCQCWGGRTKRTGHCCKCPRYNATSRA